MYKLSDMISKQVIALRGAQMLGVAADVRFSPSLKKAEALLLIDGDENDENVLALPVKNISTMKEDSVVVRFLSEPLSVSFLPSNNPMNLPCMNQDGKMLGRLSDVVLDDKFAVVSFIVGESEYSADMLLSYSDSLVIFNDSSVPIKLPRLRPKVPNPTDKNPAVKVTAHSFTPTKTPEPPSPNVGDDTEKPTVTTPTAAPSPAPDFGAPDFSFLLGKCVAQTLCASDGRIIASNGDIITAQIITEAARENKLVQLTLRAY